MKRGAGIVFKHPWKADGKIYRTDRYNGIVGYCLCPIQQPQYDKTTTGYLGLRFTDFILSREFLLNKVSKIKNEAEEKSPPTFKLNALKSF